MVSFGSVTFLNDALMLEKTSTSAHWTNALTTANNIGWQKSLRFSLLMGETYKTCVSSPAVPSYGGLVK